MSRFLGQLYLRYYSAAELRSKALKSQRYDVAQDLPYESEVLGRTIVVPSGTSTDFASIPRLVWNLLDPEDPVIGWPSVVHDYLYTCAGVLPDGFKYSREQADRVLVEGMDLCGASNFTRWAVLRSVRAFGGSHWLDNQKNEK